MEMGQRLELDKTSCKLLYDQTRYFLSTESHDLPFAGRSQPGGYEAAGKDLKESLLKTAYLLLKTRDWGCQWFGESSANAGNRLLVWPTNSTL
jgi:hypothetical protein